MIHNLKHILQIIRVPFLVITIGNEVTNYDSSYDMTHGHPRSKRGEEKMLV